MKQLITFFRAVSARQGNLLALALLAPLLLPAVQSSLTLWQQIVVNQLPAVQ